MRAGMSRGVCRAGEDVGAATILMVAGAAVLLTVVGAAVAVSDLVATGQRAGTAADLAALGAAYRLTAGPDQACVAARAIAFRNGAHLVSCHAGTGAGLDVDIVTAVEVRGPLRAVSGWLGMTPPVVHSRAVAGPPRTG